MRTVRHQQHTKNLIILPIVLLLFIPSVVSSGSLFSRNLRQGDKGVEVLSLQKRLNEDPRTQLASVGPGSPREETDFFGPLTASAVVKFQELYREDVLVPIQLLSGTGFFGPLTRAKLNSVGTKSLLPPSEPVTETSDATTPTDLVADKGPSVGNRSAVELFLDRISAINSGLSPSDLHSIESSIRNQKDENADIRKIFLEGRGVESEREVTPRSVDEILDFVDKQISSEGRSLFVSRLGELARALSPKLPRAEAVTGLISPFGGTILYPYLCTCSYTWLLFIGPPSLTILDYEFGTQGYLNYNIPEEGISVLGNSIQLGTPVCVSEPELECAVVIKSEGFITPIVGSSSL